MLCYCSIITIYWITPFPAPATVTPAITGWIGSMQCNVATTRCPDRLTEFFCIFFAAWLCRGTSEPRGTWPDRAVPHHLCVSSFYQFSLENMWEPIRLRELNPQQTEVTSRTPGGLVGQIYIMRFDLILFTIADTKVIMIQKALTPQLSREAGFGCPGLLGHLHLGGRGSETTLFFCFVKFSSVGEPNQNGNEDCTAMDPQNEGYGVSWFFLIHIERETFTKWRRHWGWNFEIETQLKSWETRETRLEKSKCFWEMNID